SLSLQYLYKLNSTFDLYFYSGYNSWDKFNVTYIVDWIPVQSKQIFKSYSSDDHILIPVYVGSKVYFNTNKLFTSFFEFEVGYSLFNYNSYENLEVINISTGEIVDYVIDESSKREMTDHLFGVGIGAGIFHPISESIRLILSYKLNSNFNSGKFGLFSAKGTYYTISTGISFVI
ncbi:MAG: hypothetical protein R3250_11595, partial [Melioribacteraceae bacterium]|nr:hypothetical protein [Melioribacteraceae bacterium]